MSTSMGCEPLTGRMVAGLGDAQRGPGCKGTRVSRNRGNQDPVVSEGRNACFVDSQGPTISRIFLRRFVAFLNWGSYACARSLAQESCTDNGALLPVHEARVTAITKEGKSSHNLSSSASPGSDQEQKTNQNAPWRPADHVNAECCGVMRGSGPIPHILLHSAWPSSWALLMILLSILLLEVEHLLGTLEGARWGQAYQAQCIVQRGRDSHTLVSAPLRGLLHMTLWG